MSIDCGGIFCTLQSPLLEALSHNTLKYGTFQQKKERGKVTMVVPFAEIQSIQT
jgi:hypothetical protein